MLIVFAIKYQEEKKKNVTKLLALTSCKAYLLDIHYQLYLQLLIFLDLKVF